MNTFIEIIGNVGNNPVLKQLPPRNENYTSSHVTTFSVAVDQYSPSSPNKKKTLWFDVEAWNGQAERVMKAVQKGSEIIVRGSISLDEYNTPDGRSIRKMIVQLQQFRLTGRAPASRQQAETTDADVNSAAETETFANTPPATEHGSDAETTEPESFTPMLADCTGKDITGTAQSLSQPVTTLA